MRIPRINLVVLTLALAGGSLADPVAWAGAAHGGAALRSITGAVGQGYGLVGTSFLRYSAKLLEKHGSAEGIQFSDMLDQELLGGLVGDIGMVLLTSQLGPMLPVAPAIRETMMVAGGFLGWELGSGHIQDTDWLMVTTEVGAASALRLGLIAAGMSAGGLPMMLITMEGSVLAGRLVEHIRSKNEGEAASAERPGGTLHPGVQLALHPGRNGALDRTGTVSDAGGDVPNPLPSGNGSYLGAQGETYLKLVDQLVRGNKYLVVDAYEDLRGRIFTQDATSAPSPEP